MKKIAIAFAAAAVSAAFMTGCGQGASQQPKLKIGVSLPAADHGWSGGIISSAELAEKEVEY